MTPLQLWFALETQLLIPSPEECHERFEPVIAELMERLPQASSMSSAMYRKQLLDRLLGTALYFATLEAARLNRDLEDCFLDLEIWAAQDYCSPVHKPPSPTRRAKTLTVPSDTPNLAAEELARFKAAVRKSLLKDLEEEERMVELSLRCEPEQLVKFLQLFDNRSIEVRRRGRTTQAWEFDECGSVLWFVSVQHVSATEPNCASRKAIEY
jgi:hypothetical protein